MNRVLELRSYQLRPGSGAAFHQLMQKRSVPLHQTLGIEVVAYGFSLHAPDKYFLMRAHDTLPQLETALVTLQRSDVWHNDLAAAMTHHILLETTTTLWLESEIIEHLRTAPPAAVPT